MRCARSICFFIVISFCASTRGADFFLTIIRNGTSQVYSTSQDISYNVGDIVKFECSITDNLYMGGTTNAILSWCYDDACLNYYKHPVIFREIILKRDDDYKSLECKISSNSQSELTIAANFRRNKSELEIAREKPNLFKIILLVLGAVVAATILALIGYKIIQCVIKNKSHNEESIRDIPMESNGDKNHSQPLKAEEPLDTVVGIDNLSCENNKDTENER